MPLPRMTWASVATITVAALPGEPSTTVRAVLQDNKSRTFTGTLTFNFALGVAENGLDAGAEGASTWYYLYLVPTVADDNVLCLRASVNPPATGPTGYVNFRYIGAFFNLSTSDIRQFRQRGIEFDYYNGYDAQCKLVLTPAGKDAGKVSLSLTTWVPATAAAAKCGLYLESVANTWAQFNIYAEVSAGTAATASCGIVAANSGTQLDDSTGYCEVPIVITTARNLYYQRVGGNAAPAADSEIYCYGFTDGYLR